MIRPRRLLGAAAALLGATGTVLCVAGVAGVWVLHADLSGRADRSFGRVETGLAAARDDLARAGDRIHQTRRDVEAVERREDAPAVPPPPPGRRLSRPAAGSMSAQLADARRLLTTATELGLVADGLLDVLAELPGGERLGIDAARLHETSDQLSDLIRTADRVAAALPRPPDGGPPDADDSAPQVADRLGRVAAAVEAAADRADAARGRVEGWHRRAVHALTVAAVAATTLLVWIGLGQWSLTVHGYRWVRGR